MIAVIACDRNTRDSWLSPDAADWPRRSAMRWDSVWLRWDL